MAALTVGSVVLIPFPFSDLSQAKLRPAIVLAGVGRGDWIFCQVTSNPFGDEHSITLEAGHFHQGSLQRTSYARPGKLFTATSELVKTQVGCLTPQAFSLVIDAVVAIFTASLA